MDLSLLDLLLVLQDFLEVKAIKNISAHMSAFFYIIDENPLSIYFNRFVNI